MSFGLTPNDERTLRSIFVFSEKTTILRVRNLSAAKRPNAGANENRFSAKDKN